LRHQFISSLADSGIHPKDAQILARHSTIDLTMNRYTHRGLRQHAAALDKMPALPTRNQPQEMRGNRDGRTSRGTSRESDARERKVCEVASPF
jgi:hypothetical protein